MSKRSALMLVCSCLLLVGPSFAAETTDSAPAATVPEVSETPVGPDGLPALAPGLEQPEVVYKSCSASLTCHDGTYISCSLPSGTCTSVPSNCSAGQAGYVQCGSSRTNCAPCCSGTLYCEDINNGLYPPSVCPARCIIRSDNSCGFCMSGPGGGCLCTE